MNVTFFDEAGHAKVRQFDLQGCRRGLFLGGGGGGGVSVSGGQQRGVGAHWEGDVGQLDVSVHQAAHLVTTSQVMSDEVR